MTTLKTIPQQEFKNISNSGKQHRCSRWILQGDSSQ